MTAWKLRCSVCGTVWILKVSYDISDFKRLYHYCRKCGKNTYHEILGRID